MAKVQNNSLEMECNKLAQELIDKEDYQQVRKAVEKMPHETRGVFINKLKQVIAAQMHERPTWSSEMSMQMLLAIQYLHSCKGVSDYMGLSNISASESDRKLLNMSLVVSSARGWLAHAQEQPEELPKVRQMFMRSVRKSMHFWGLKELEDMLTHLMDPCNVCGPRYSPTHYGNQLDKIEYVTDFCLANLAMFPVGVDVWSYVFRYMLCCRLEDDRDRRWFTRMADELFNTAHYIQILAKNYKFGIEFLRSSYNDKECLYIPYRPFIMILGRLQEPQLHSLLLINSIGLQWDKQELSNCILNCIKFGINESCSRVLMGFVRLAETHRKYAQLLPIFEHSIPKLFIFMKHCKLFAASFKLLKHFVLSPFPTVSLYQKLVEKAVLLAHIISEPYLTQLLQLLQTVAYLYKQTTNNFEIDQLLEAKLPIFNRLSDRVIRSQIAEHSWQLSNNSASKLDTRTERTYRGLTNIGNSCYLNSFLQGLFMTTELRRDVLAASTLQLEQKMLGRIAQQNQNIGNEGMVVRESIRPFAQFQRIFALLLRSKRTAISPLPIRNISPPQFHNNYQQDSIEFGRALLELVSRSDFPNYFKGQITTHISCSSCGIPRERVEDFVDLILSTEKGTPQTNAENHCPDRQTNNSPHPPNDSVNSDKPNKPVTAPGDSCSEPRQFSLQKMVQRVFDEQQVAGLICDHCSQTSQQSAKRSYISKFPNYLILTIKRFSYCAVEQRNKKLISKVTLTECLLMHTTQYELYAIVVHRGPSANSGHYFTFAREGQGWLCFNDSEVNNFASFGTVKDFLDISQQDTPYLLFFQRKTHVEAIREQLTKPIILRKPLENYIQKDNLEYAKSLQKKVPLHLNLPKWNYPRKDDDESQGAAGGSQFDFNSFVS